MKKKAKTKEVEAKPAPPAFIRMLMSLSTSKRAYFAGTVVRVGEEVSIETALNWIQCGVAEEDRSILGPPEVK